MPSPSELIKMMLGVVDAAIYLNEQHLVHLAIMADNILVGQDNVCKLTGFQFTREMTEEVLLLFMSGEFKTSSDTPDIGFLLAPGYSGGMLCWCILRNLVDC